jgi:hypothetical protein
MERKRWGLSPAYTRKEKQKRVMEITTNDGSLLGLGDYGQIYHETSTTDITLAWEDRPEGSGKLIEEIEERVEKLKEMLLKSKPLSDLEDYQVKINWLGCENPPPIVLAILGNLKRVSQKYIRRLTQHSTRLV